MDTRSGRAVEPSRVLITIVVRAVDSMDTRSGRAVEPSRVLITIVVRAVDGCPLTLTRRRQMELSCGGGEHAGGMRNGV
jgi:hypothetical protein